MKKEDRHIFRIGVVENLRIKVIDGTPEFVQEFQVDNIMWTGLTAEQRLALQSLFTTGQSELVKLATEAAKRGGGG